MRIVRCALTAASQRPDPGTMHRRTHHPCTSAPHTSQAIARLRSLARGWGEPGHRQLSRSGSHVAPAPVARTFARRTGARHPVSPATVATQHRRALTRRRHEGPAIRWRMTTLPGSASLRSPADRGPRDLGPNLGRSAGVPLADTADQRHHAMRPPLPGPAAPPRRGHVRCRQRHRHRAAPRRHAT